SENDNDFRRGRRLTANLPRLLIEPTPTAPEPAPDFLGDLAPHASLISKKIAALPGEVKPSAHLLTFCLMQRPGRLAPCRGFPAPSAPPTPPRGPPPRTGQTQPESPMWQKAPPAARINTPIASAFIRPLCRLRTNETSVCSGKIWPIKPRQSRDEQTKVEKPT